jgi:glutamate synthase (ferredoxin)
VGKNFAAGMSGGIAYVLDRDHQLYLNINKELVTMETVTERYDILQLTDLISQHVAATGSALGRRLLEHMEEYIPSFKKIVPKDYSRMLTAIAKLEEKGMSQQQAELEAFYAIAAE